MTSLFERVRRVTGDIPWESFAQVMAKPLEAGADAASEVIGQLTEWGSHFTRNALAKWTLAAIVETPCSLLDYSSGKPKPCRMHAVCRCDACDKPCCLAHARVNYDADAVCEECVSAVREYYAAQAGVPPGPPPAPSMSAKEHAALKVLKLPKTATWEEIRKRYRALIVKHNADRPQPEKTRAANTVRLKAINAAYEILRAVHERKAAA